MLGRPITNIETSVADEEPIGGIDGNNVTFTISHAPVDGTFRLFLNGLKLNNVEHYSLIGDTIVLEDPPLSGDILSCVYNY